LLLYRSAPHPDLHSFPTRRSSDLLQSPFTVSASASSGLPVTFTTTTPGVCTSSGSDGSTITLVAAGTCTVQADQASNSTYAPARSEEHTSELQSRFDLVCRLLLEK